MTEARLDFRQIGQSEIAEIKALFLSVFTAQPWNDDWSDGKQLDLYLDDLTGHRNSLTFGLYEDGRLIALSMGHIRHWYSGTEYFIDELCVRTERQHCGVGTHFVREIERAIRAMGVVHLFLLTEKTVPAYDFYRKNGFAELRENVAFCKRL